MAGKNQGTEDGAAATSRSSTRQSWIGSRTQHREDRVSIYVFHADIETFAILKWPMPEDLEAELERLRAENQALKERGRTTSVSMKVSEKGAISVYGLGRFPVTLYKEQWQKLLSMSNEIKAFISENEDRLKTKEKG
ncbi:MAG: hypothetical protein ACR2IV_03885 [Bryobacteraceae bacterium]